MASNAVVFLLVTGVSFILKGTPVLILQHLGYERTSEMVAVVKIVDGILMMLWVLLGIYLIATNLKTDRKKDVPRRTRATNKSLKELERRTWLSRHPYRARHSTTDHRRLLVLRASQLGSGVSSGEMRELTISPDPPTTRLQEIGHVNITKQELVWRQGLNYLAHLCTSEPPVPDGLARVRWTCVSDSLTKGLKLNTHS